MCFPLETSGSLGEAIRAGTPEHSSLADQHVFCVDGARAIEFLLEQSKNRVMCQTLILLKQVGVGLLVCSLTCAKTAGEMQRL